MKKSLIGVVFSLLAILLIACGEANIPVVDTEKPIITLTGGTSVIEVGEAFVPPTVTVTDNIDNDLMAVIGGDQVDNTTPGTYTITYNAADRAGNEADEKIFVVTVLETDDTEYDESMDIINGDFETGDLSGWTIEEVNGSNEAFSDDFVVNDPSPYKEGDYFFDGSKTDDDRVGAIRSSIFTLGGSGWIRFRLGGGNDPERLYLAVYRADTHEMIASFANSNPQKYGGNEFLVGYKFDLLSLDGVELGDAFYIRVVDRKISDWAIIKIDDVKTYNRFEPSGPTYELATNTYEPIDVVAPSEYDIINGGFETGNLSGWTAYGEAFANNHVETNDLNGKVGNAYLTSNKGDHLTGYIESSNFTLGGSGWLTFRLGGGNFPEELYIGVYQSLNDQMIAKFAHSVAPLNEGEISLTPYRFDLTSVADFGDELYIRIVDNRSGGWGILNVDEIVTNHASQPVDGYTTAINTIDNEPVAPSEYDIVNGGFETGDLSGWIIEEISGSTLAFEQGLVVSDNKDLKEGVYYFSGTFAGDDKTGALRSSTFTLGGSGWMSFLLAGGHKSTLYVGVYDAQDDTLLAQFFNTAAPFNEGTQDFTSYRFDLTTVAELGDSLYLKIVDAETGGWGILIVDGFNVNLADTPSSDTHATALNQVE